MPECDVCGATIMFRPAGDPPHPMICLTAEATPLSEVKEGTIYRALSWGWVRTWTPGDEIPFGASLHEFHTALPGHDHKRARTQPQKEGLF